MNIIELLQQYWPALLAALTIGGAAVWLWATDRKRAEEMAWALAKQIWALVMATAKKEIADVTDEEVIAEARKLYAQVPDSVARWLPEELFLSMCLGAWHRFAELVIQTGSVRQAVRMLR